MLEDIYIPKKSIFDPDKYGHFGEFGGMFVPETLMGILLDLSKEYKKYRFDRDFWLEVNDLLNTPITCLLALAGFARGPKTLNMVRMPKSFLIGATCFIAG